MSTSTFKPVVGFTDGLVSRCQEYAPTQYAVGKLRAARTPYDRDGLVINDANLILRPGLYLMELNENTKNTANIKAGVLYIYHLTADPDESVHGGHVTDPVSDTNMYIRQIGYFHNGSVERVMTRVGTPLNNYGTITVKHLENIEAGTTGTTFVSELGIWVNHHTVDGKFIIEPAVTWSDWREVTGGGSGGAIYNFDTTKNNGVGLISTDPNTYAAAADWATATTGGVVRVIAAVSMIQDDSYRYSVPNANAIYSALSSVSSNLGYVSSVVSNVSSALNNTNNSALETYNILSDHISNNHPTNTEHADIVDGVAVLGTVYPASNVTSINKIYATAKYTVPTVNAVYNVSSSLNSMITLVSTTLSEHITNHPGGGEGIDISGVKWPLAIEPNEEYEDVPYLTLKYDVTSSYAGVKLSEHEIDPDAGSSAIVAVGQPAGIGSWGVVKTTDEIVSYSHTDVVEDMVSGYVDEFTVPTVNAVYNITSAINGAITLVSSTLSNHIANHPGGTTDPSYNGPFNVQLVDNTISVGGTPVDEANGIAGRMYYAGNASFVMPTDTLDATAGNIYAYVYVDSIANNGVVTYSSGYAVDLANVPTSAKGSQGAYRLIAQVSDGSSYQVQYGDIVFPARY